MNKSFFVIAVLFACCNLSSCVYYQPMPTEWSSQLSGTEKCEGFSGYYELADDYERPAFKYLRYLKNTPIYGADPKVISGVNIRATELAVEIEFYASQRLVHKENFDKDSFKCTTGKLTLNMENKSSSGTGVDIYDMPTITMYLSKTEDIFVKRKVTAVGLVFLVPVVVGENTWFKLTRIHNKLLQPTANESAE